MPKCPLNNFEKCDKDCAWYVNGIKTKGCAVKYIAYSKNLTNLNAIQRDISSIDDTLTRNPNRE